MILAQANTDGRSSVTISSNCIYVVSSATAGAETLIILDGSFQRDWPHRLREKLPRRSIHSQMALRGCCRSERHLKAEKTGHKIEREPSLHLP